MLKGEAKKTWQREYMRDYRRKTLRKTQAETVRPRKTLRKTQSVRPTIKELQAKIDSIKPQELEVKHRCLQCQALGKYAQAIEEADLYTEQGVKRAWLCGYCLSKVEVSSGF